MSKAAKNALIGALVVGGLAVLYAGLRAMAQDAAKEAVTDTITQNTVSIAELKKAVSENDKVDNIDHTEFKAAVKLITQELETIKAQNRELKEQMLQQTERNRIEIEALKRLLLEYFKNQK